MLANKAAGGKVRVRLLVVINTVKADKAGHKKRAIITTATGVGDKARAIITTVRAVGGDGNPTQHSYPSPHPKMRTVHPMMPPARSVAVAAKPVRKALAMAAQAVIARAIPTTTTAIFRPAAPMIMYALPTITMAFLMTTVTMVIQMVASSLAAEL